MRSVYGAPDLHVASALFSPSHFNATSLARPLQIGSGSSFLRFFICFSVFSSFGADGLTSANDGGTSSLQVAISALSLPNLISPSAP